MIAWSSMPETLRLDHVVCRQRVDRRDGGLRPSRDLREAGEAQCCNAQPDRERGALDAERRGQSRRNRHRHEVADALGRLVDRKHAALRARRARCVGAGCAMVRQGTR